MSRVFLWFVIGALVAVSDCARGCELVSVARQVEVAGSVREAVGTYFAHWDSARGETFSKAWADYVAKASAKRCRRDFSLDSMALLASLGNGHTKFTDNALWARSTGPTGLAVAYVDGSWLVMNSQRPQVSPGAEIVSIDDEAIEAFYLRQKRYISASSDLVRRGKLFNMSILFGDRFKLAFADGASVTLNRADKPGYWRNPPAVKVPAGVAFHVIPTFSDPRFEKRAIDFIKAHDQSSAIILDVRGNGGGTTPSSLMSSLIQKEYTSWGEMSALSVGLLKAYGEMYEPSLKADDPVFAGWAEGMQAYFARPMLYAPGARIVPATPIYRNALYILVDRDCGSACEDFVYAMKASGRAVIVGETTYGSSGQPKLVDMGDGMEFQIGAKRMVFADGSPFEGIGIAPDIEVKPAIEDIRANRDTALEVVLKRLAH